nr:hypothetical protein [Thermocrispum municipale]
MTFTVRADIACTTTFGLATLRCSISHSTVPARIVTTGRPSRSSHDTESFSASGWSTRAHTPSGLDTSGIRRNPGELRQGLEWIRQLLAGDPNTASPLLVAALPDTASVRRKLVALRDEARKEL